MDLPIHIENNIRARALARKGDCILVAVSGGLDSMVLLHVLHRLSQTHRWHLTVAHFNHQLRGAASKRDERLVGQIARSLNLPVITGAGNVRRAAAEMKCSIEMAARALRHEFLAVTAARLKIGTVALAHHADDQVELFFLRLFRGTGTEGLGGMRWSAPSPVTANLKLVRPLLDVPKADLLQFAADHKIPFSEDASNASHDIQRNRIRHELIPRLIQDYQPALTKTVLRLMEVAGAEAEFIAESTHQQRGKKFSTLPVALQRRMVYEQLLTHKIAADFEMVERLRLAEGQWFAINAVECASRDGNGTVRWRPNQPLQFNGSETKFRLVARGQKQFEGVKIQWETADIQRTNKACNGWAVEYFDADKVGADIGLRLWRPGDRFHPIGMASPKKLQDLFTDLKVPRLERRKRVVATSGNGEVFWVEGLRMAENFKRERGTTRTLAWRWHRDAGGVSSELRTKERDDSLTRGRKHNVRSK